MQIALKAHEGQKRKGTDIPYITHPLGVALILSKVGADHDVVAAGILHDTVEDTDVTLEEIRKHFGQRIADLVEGASEPDKSLSWQERKEHTLAYLKLAPLDVRIVSCADKLHNVRSIKRDLAELGDVVWSRFNRGKENQAWYYRGVVKSLGHGGSFKLMSELRSEVENVFSVAKSISLPLKTIHAEAWRIGEEGYEDISQMYEYLTDQGMSFEINSEGTDIVLAFCLALKKLFGLYNYELWPHIKRNLRYL